MDEQYTSERIAVPPAFEEIFTYFYHAANTGTQTIQKTFVPSFQTILVFSFGTTVSLTTAQQNTLTCDTCMVVGPVKQSFLYTLPPGADILVANFKEDAFYRFFGQTIVLAAHPDELLEENCFTELWQTLKNIPDTASRVQYILQFCEPYIKERNLLSERLVALTSSNDMLNPVKIVARETQQSERAVQMKQKAQFGYSVKEITRYQRFLKAIHFVQQQLEQGQKIDWFEIIHDCGYYDQSQLIHDFKHYLHLSPTRFVQFQQDICIATPG